MRNVYVGVPLKAPMFPQSGQDVMAGETGEGGAKPGEYERRDGERQRTVLGLGGDDLARLRWMGPGGRDGRSAPILRPAGGATHERPRPGSVKAHGKRAWSSKDWPRTSSSRPCGGSLDSHAVGIL
jgi:hypothetical protein